MPWLSMVIAELAAAKAQPVVMTKLVNQFAGLESQKWLQPVGDDGMPPTVGSQTGCMPWHAWHAMACQGARAKCKVTAQLLLALRLNAKGYDLRRML